MDKRPERKQAKKNELVAVALELFFEKGYEGTSIHMIQEKIGKKVTGFYYYFDSKDAIFDAAVNMFFVPYEKRMREIVDGGKDRPDRELTRFIDYLNEATQSFREQYLKKLHWSVLAAIREHTMLVMKKYIGEILDNYLAKGLVSLPAADIGVAVNLLAFGVGGSILYQSGGEYARQQPDVKRLITKMLGLPDEL